MKNVWFSLGFVLLLVGSIAAQEKGELFRFRFASLNDPRHLYKIGPNLPPELVGYKKLGPVFMVAPNDGPNLHPIYISSFIDVNPYTKDSSVSYYYSRMQKPQKGFTSGGIAFYVSSIPSQGTVPLYGYSKVTGVNEYGTATFDYRFTTDSKPPGPKWEEHGHMGYVWPLGYAELPDLKIVKTTVRDSGIEAVFRNEGKTQISSQPGVSAVLEVYDRDGKKLVFFSGAKQFGGMSGGQQRPYLFDTGPLDLKRKYYRVQVDAANLVSESNENNNDTGKIEIPGPKVDLSKIKPWPPGYVPPPTIAIKDIRNAPNGRASYSIAVTNRESFKPDTFQSLENVLPPNPCGGGDTNARMIARVVVISGAQSTPVGCKPLNSQADLALISVTTSNKLKDTDKLKITIEDRASGDKFQSGEFAVGWFGVDKVLVPAGCKYFLGRANHYLCTTDQGMKTCEGLRTQGKPIQCTRSGKQN